MRAHRELQRIQRDRAFLAEVPIAQLTASFINANKSEGKALGWRDCTFFADPAEDVGIMPEVAAAIMALHHERKAAPILLAAWPDVVKAATAEAKAPSVRALVDDRREVWLIAPQWENGCIRAGLAAVGRMVSGPLLLRDVDRPLVSYMVTLPERQAAGWIEGRVLVQAAR